MARLYSLEELYELWDIFEHETGFDAPIRETFVEWLEGHVQPKLNTRKD